MREKLASALLWSRPVSVVRICVSALARRARAMSSSCLVDASWIFDSSWCSAVFERLDLRGLLVVLRLEAVGGLLERVAARQRFAGQVVLALFDCHLGALLPVVGFVVVVLVALVQQLFVGDRGRHLGLDLHQLIVHVDDQLLDDFLRVFSTIDHVVDVGPEERGDTVQDAHMWCENLPRCAAAT